MSITRVKPDVAAVVFDASIGSFVPLSPGVEYDTADPLVKAHPWAFTTDTDRAARGRVTSASVEQATAGPGELRKTQRS